MFSKIYQSFFANLTYNPATKFLVLRAPLYDFKGITFDRVYMRDGYLIVEMKGSSRETKIEPKLDEKYSECKV
jgi:hypothetical protein